MLHGPDLLTTLAGGLTAALIFGYITQRIGLSPIVGYLLAGVAVGPNTPGFVADSASATQLAEIGVILLMFGVGIHFHLEDLLSVWKMALPGALIGSLMALSLGTLVGLGFGWSATPSVVFGLTLSVASTVVLTRVLTDANDLHTPTGHLAIGWLVVEDLFTVLVLVLMPVLFPAEGSTESVGWAVARAGLRIVGLIAVAVLVGSWAVPWLLTRAAETGSRELFTLTVLVVALGIAVGSAQVFGVSMALGAFLAGMVVGRSDFGLRAGAEALPLRDAFAVLFFVSVGMLFDPKSLLTAPGLLIATLCVVLLGKPLLAFALVWLAKFPPRVAVALGLSLGQIGEFSFLLAEAGKKLGLLDAAAMNALVGAAIVTISINPLLYRLVDPIAKRLGRGTVTGPEPSQTGPRYRAVVVGYGPVGRTICRLLRDNGIEPTVIEMNLGTVIRMREEGTRAVYGDAGHLETLEAAGVAGAATLILSASGWSEPAEVIRLARSLNGDIRVLVRAAYLRERGILRVAGADDVYTGEGEVALAMAEAVLRELGAVPEQIDRERERVRADLFKGE